MAIATCILAAAMSAAAVPETMIDGSNPLVKTRFTADPAGYSEKLRQRKGYGGKDGR